MLLCLFLVALWSTAGKGMTSWLSCLLSFVTFPNMSWSTSELSAMLTPKNWFKPSSKIFFWPFKGGFSFVDLLCFCSVLCLLCLCARLFICALMSPAEKGLTYWLSCVVLDCIDSWSLQPYLLSNCEFVTFPLVSWVRCGTWLFRFLIFIPLLTSHTTHFSTKANYIVVFLWS